MAGLTPELAAVTFGLLSALAWGAGDFNGGLATRKTGVLGVVFVSHVLGGGLLLALALLTGEPMPPASDLIWGGVSGLAGVAGLVALYRAFASGRMGIAAPVSGVLTAALPVLFSIGMRGLPQAEQLVGFALAFLAIWLVAFTPGETPDTGSVGMAVLAGLGFGVFFILLDQVRSDAVFWPLVAARALSTAAIFAALRLTRRLNALPRSRDVLALVALSSTLDVAGNVFFLAATQAGRLDIAAVVSSLYPASTLLLARVFLQERLSRLQFAGVLSALAAIVLITW